MVDLFNSRLQAPGVKAGFERCYASGSDLDLIIETTTPGPGDVPLRKISYVMSVAGQPYQLGAGIYDETVTLEELAALTADTK